MFGWLQALLAIAGSIPEVIKLVEDIIAAINGHPNGPAAGVKSLQDHLATLPKPMDSDAKVK